MKKRFLLFFALGIMLSAAWGQRTTEKNIPLPSQAQLNWHSLERIMFVHWGMATWQGREYDNHTTDLSTVNPRLLNTDQWCEVAKVWGARMIIFVAKHTGGFCWWQTQTSDYGVKELKWRDGKGDVLEDLSKSCKKYGLQLGIYIYPGDDHWGAGIGSGGITADPSKQEAYNKIFRQQLTEVLSNYGEIKEVWFDGNCKIDVKDILEKYAANAVVFQGQQASLRWVGNEDGIAPYPNWYTLSKEDLATGTATALASDMNGNAYAPVEIDVPLLKNKGHKWFWAPNTDSLILSTSQLMNLYYKSVGRGSVLLLNSTPDTTGLIPLPHVKAYTQFGQEIKRRFEFPVSFTSGKGKQLSVGFQKPVTVNHFVIQENLIGGQRVREYVIKGKVDGKWKVLCKGSSIGYKRIEYIEDTQVTAVSLEIVKSKGEADIMNFSMYRVETDLDDLNKENDGAKPVQASFWDKNSFSSDQYRDFTVDLTDLANQTGEYILSFNQLSMDYASGKSSALLFNDVRLDIYGSQTSVDDGSFIKQINANQFLITNSQQTLKEFPIKFRAKIKHGGANSVGEITIKKLQY